MDPGSDETQNKRRCRPAVALVVGLSLALGGCGFFATAAPDPAPIAKPDSSNTGPRISLTRTLTASQALSELRENKRLSGVRIIGNIRLSGDDGRGWVIEDSRIESTGHYALRGYVNLEPFTGTTAERPIFRHVDIIGAAGTGRGRSSASVYGSDMVIDHADIYGADDGVKPTGRIDILNSWIHDSDHPRGAHCDGIQIRSGTEILIKGTRIDAYYGYSSDRSATPGATCSGGLQTGSVTGAIQARWEDNWFAGGHPTIRGARGTDGSRVDYVFRNNKWMQYGTSVVLGRSDLPPNQNGPIVGDLGDFDSSNVWEHTGQPVR